MPTLHNNSTTGYQWCVTTPEKTKSKGYLVAHQSINVPSGKLEVSGIDGKWEIAGSDHVRVTQGKVIVEKGGARQATSPMATTLAGLLAGNRTPNAPPSKPAAAGPGHNYWKK